LQIHLAAEDRPRHLEVIAHTGPRAKRHTGIALRQADLVGEIRALHPDLEAMAQLHHDAGISV
jgi:hypothetical protein